MSSRHHPSQRRWVGDRPAQAHFACDNAVRREEGLLAYRAVEEGRSGGYSQLSEVPWRGWMGEVIVIVPQAIIVLVATFST